MAGNSEDKVSTSWLSKEPVVIRWKPRDTDGFASLGYQMPSSWKADPMLWLGLSTAPNGERLAQIWCKCPIRVESEPTIGSSIKLIYNIEPKNIRDFKIEQCSSTITAEVQAGMRNSSTSTGNLVHLQFDLKQPGSVAMPAASKSAFPPARQSDHDVVQALKSLSEATRIHMYFKVKNGEYDSSQQLSRAKLEALRTAWLSGELGSTDKLNVTYQSKGHLENAWEIFDPPVYDDATAARPENKRKVNSSGTQKEDLSEGSAVGVQDDKREGTEVRPLKRSRTEDDPEKVIPKFRDPLLTATWLQLAQEISKDQLELLRHMKEFFDWVRDGISEGFVNLFTRPAQLGSIYGDRAAMITADLLTLGYHARTGDKSAFRDTFAKCRVDLPFYCGGLSWARYSDRSRTASALYDEMMSWSKWTLEIETHPEKSMFGFFELGQFAREADWMNFDDLLHTCLATFFFRVGRMPS
ncbi:uncharacterized protein K452DRAFT_106922 [Aplosporella prunicola CBS 121167]|uniref:Uncharacterized protein n=1 Tax=Aplosporella prunicola CBS 121167 TaxID=1176127 RepID=A0A6A6BPV0_9PEZI|nr:uncharacterized protein K452DRAFT_106922 [Aplosporella prunicola CBS 121167]KAF2146169.1 hypothetical protein K452DRAFT_106922 [Aplosporella prunicola CBS 121167]